MAGAPVPVKTVGEEFVAHRLLNPKHFIDPNALPEPLTKALIRPVNMQEYVINPPYCQTDQCTILARRFYNRMIKENYTDGTFPKLTECIGIHSNMFIVSHNDPLSYFHVYFKGKLAGKKQRFFAELSGQDQPLSVKSCVPVHKTTGSMVNCKYCFGGLRHPPQGGFIGHRTGPPSMLKPMPVDG